MRWKRGHHSARASGRSISGAKYFSPMPRSDARGIVGKAVGKSLRELAERIVDRRAAIGGRQRHVDGIERVELQDIFGVDRIGIAQPVLDRGDRQFQRPRRARRLWRGLRDRLDLVGAIEFIGEADIFLAGRLRGFPALVAGDRFQPVQETRGDRGRAADLGGVAEDDVLGAEQLREIVRREADAPLRQIEAEFMPHRPAQPRIDPRRRRPDAFDQPADDDAVGLRQPRFQRAIDFQMNVGRPPAAAPCGRQTRSGTLPDNRRAAPSARFAFCRRADRRTRRPAPIPAGPRTRPRRRARRATTRSARRDGVRRVRRNRTVLTRRDFPAAPARSARPSINACARSSASSLKPGPRLGAVQRGRSRRSSVCASSSRKRAKSRARPPLPACGRVPRNSASSSASMASLNAPGAPPSRHSGCFSSASSVGGSSCFAAASAASRAKMPADVSISASPPESSKARFQRPSAAITRRASARSGVTSAADLSRCRASRIATAIASASISGLAASITARFVMPRGNLRGDLRLGQPPMPLRGRVGGPHRLGSQHVASVRRRRRRGFRRRCA